MVYRKASTNKAIGKAVSVANQGVSLIGIAPKKGWFNSDSGFREGEVYVIKGAETVKQEFK
jgi:hypothetical protein